METIGDCVVWIGIVVMLGIIFWSSTWDQN